MLSAQSYLSRPRPPSRLLPAFTGHKRTPTRSGNRLNGKSSSRAAFPSVSGLPRELSSHSSLSILASDICLVGAWLIERSHGGAATAGTTRLVKPARSKRAAATWARLTTQNRRALAADGPGRNASSARAASAHAGMGATVPVLLLIRVVRVSQPQGPSSY